MTIRNKLALRFMLLASLILGIVLIVVYSMSGRYRIEEFRARLFDRGSYTAMLLLQVDEVDEQVLNRIEKESPTLVPWESIKIFDNTGREIYSSGSWNRGKVSEELLDRVRNADDVVELDRAGEAIGFQFADGSERYVVLVSGQDRFGRSKLRNLGRVMLVTYAAGVLLTFIVGRIYAQRALEPIKRLVDEVRSIHVGNLLKRVGTGNGQDEIAQLASSFNELLERLDQAFNAQRNFIANASHELRTPLTVISGQLEVLLLMERTSAEYRNAVNSVLDDMRSLNKLSNRLLLLAQADSRVSQAAFVPVRIDEVIWQVRSELLRTNARNVIDVDLPEVEDEHFMQVPGNEDLLRSMVFNLMENGCKYSPQQRVELSIAIGDGQIAMEFADRGIGIPAEDRARIFSPFFRGKNTSGIPGHGIGLSLIYRITQIHRGKVSFSDRAGGGSIFKVVLPHL